MFAATTAASRAILEHLVRALSLPECLLSCLPTLGMCLGRTVDLAFVLHKYGVHFRFLTMTMGVDPSYEHQSFYKTTLDDDTIRVNKLFSQARAERIAIEQRSLSMSDFCDLVRLQQHMVRACTHYRWDGNDLAAQRNVHMHMYVTHACAQVTGMGVLLVAGGGSSGSPSPLPQLFQRRQLLRGMGLALLQRICRTLCPRCWLRCATRWLLCLRSSSSARAAVCARQRPTRGTPMSRDRRGLDRRAMAQ